MAYDRYMADKIPPNDNDDEAFTPFSLGDPSNPITQLNKEFYGEYDEEYFVKKSFVLASFIADSKPIIEALDKGYTVGKLKVQDSNIDSSWMEGYAKRELAINSYHAIESLFRLFFAHAEEPESPWVGVEQMRNFYEFKGKVEKVVSGKYFKGDHGEAVAKLLIGSRELYKSITDEEWQKGIDNSVHILTRLGSDILSNQDYNVYKHGAALLDTQFGFKLDDGKVFGADKQDTFMYLSSKHEESIVKFSKTYKFIRWEQRLTNTYLAGMLLYNLLVLNKSRLKIAQLNDTPIHTFYKLDRDRIFDFDKGDRPVMPDTISVSLFERHYSKKQNGKKKNAK